MSFQQRALFVIATALFFVVLLRLVWHVREVLLIAFLGIVLAAFLRACAKAVHRVTRLPDGWSLAVSCLLLAAFIGLGVWLLLPPIITQANQLFQQLPQFLQQARTTLEGLRWGRTLLEQLPVLGEEGATQLGAISQRVLSTATFTFTTIANVLLVVVTGIFLAANPRTYTRGLLHLMPRAVRPRATLVLSESGRAVRHWLVGQLLAMTFVGVLCWLGLTIIGVPLALVLGVLAGLLDFIPFFGPFFAALPAVLLGLTQGFWTGVWTLVLYVVVQQIEGNVIQPLIQRWAVDIPPALLVLTLVVMGQLFGLIGLLVATPLLAVLLVLVKHLYVEDILHDKLPET